MGLKRKISKKKSKKSRICGWACANRGPEQKKMTENPRYVQSRKSPQKEVK